MLNVDKNIALAFRCVTKPNFDTTTVQFSYVVKIEVDNKRLLDSDFSLYDELRAINTVQAIATAESIAEAEAEN